MDQLGWVGEGLHLGGLWAGELERGDTSTISRRNPLLLTTRSEISATGRKGQQQRLDRERLYLLLSVKIPLTPPSSGRMFFL